MSAKEESIRATVTVQAPLRGSVSVTVETTVAVCEPVGASEAVAMMRRESRDAVDLMNRATAVVRDYLDFRAPDGIDQESDPAETPARPRWEVEVYTSATYEEACQDTKRLLKRLGVMFVEINLATAGIAHHMRLLARGIKTAPGVLVREPGTGQVVAAWGGHRPDVIVEHFGGHGWWSSSGVVVDGAEGGNQ